jgi:type VI secretion system protein ImpH
MDNKFTEYDFYQLIELLYRNEGQDIEQLENLFPEDEKIRFVASGSLGFPTGDIVSVNKHSKGYEVEVSFLGLQGSQSPLPGYYLENVARQYIHGEEGPGQFLNFFNHRFLMLLHRAWRKYRYHVRYRQGGRDRFSQCMFSLIGLGSKALRQSLSINHSKMLAYSGLLAAPGRSPQVVEGLISHCFDLKNVHIHCWQYRRVAIAKHQQNMLGRANISLGEDLVIGDFCPDISSKYILEINELAYAEFLRFLPNGDLFTSLVTVMSFIMREQFAWDLELNLAKKQFEKTCLGAGNGCLLGWTTFLAPVPQEPKITLRVQE